MCTLGYVGGGNRCGGGYPVGNYVTHWVTGLWFTQTKVEGMPKAAWHWGSNSIVIHDSFEEPCHSPSYVGLLSTWGIMDSEWFSLMFMGGLPDWGL
jgi:hypothetical protein